MRRIIAISLYISLFIGTLVACGDTKKTPMPTYTDEATTKEPTKAPEPPSKTPEMSTEPISDRDENEIVVTVPDIFMKDIVEKYAEMHPEFTYKFRVLFPVGNWEDELYEFGVDSNVAPDIAFVSTERIYDYTEGKYAEVTCPYEELGLDVDALIKGAEVEPYVVDTGTRVDGKLVALSIESTVGGFYYRRSIAKAVWGTDEPAEVQKKIGGSWDDFLKAAQEMKEKGYAIVSSYEELWNPLGDSATKGWVVDGRLYIDPKREAFFEIAKIIRSNSYDTGTTYFSDEWSQDIRGERSKQVFGYFNSSAWFLQGISNDSKEKSEMKTYGDWAVCQPTCSFNTDGQYLVVNSRCKNKKAVGEFVKWFTLNTGKDGYQYQKLDGQFVGLNDRYKDMRLEPGGVPSAKVMKSVNPKSLLDFFGGQDIYKTFASFGDANTSSVDTQYDIDLMYFWFMQVEYYVDGEKTKKQAIEDFKTLVKEQYGDEILVE